MMKAFLFLEWNSLRNAVMLRARRLREPKYLGGFLMGAAYFYWFVIRNTARNIPGGRGLWSSFNLPPADWAILLCHLAAMLVLTLMLLSWVFSAGKAVLRFTETEVALLFPAPIHRRTLLNYKLATAQLRILLTCVLFALMFGKLTPQASFPLRAVGFWILFTGMHLHQIAAGFSCQRLAARGLATLPRQLLAGLVLALWLGGVGYWFYRVGPEIIDKGAQGLSQQLQSSALSLLLLPLRLLLQPLCTTNLAAFLASLAPAAAMLGLLYLWILGTYTEFEEASTAAAEKRSKVLNAAREGRALFAPKKLRKEPFVLQATGPLQVAFLWRGLIAAGRWSHPRILLLTLGVLCAVLGALQRYPSGQTIAVVLTTILMSLGVSVLFTSGILLRKAAPQMIQRMETMKGMPLVGWKIVLGEMITPLYIFTALFWVLMALFAYSIHCADLSGLNAPFHLAGSFGMGLLAAAILCPFYFGLVTSLNFASALFFPAWAANMSGQTADLAVIGQRLFFMLGFLLVLVVAALPAVAVGSVPFLLLYFISHSVPAAIFYGGITTAVALGCELACIIWWLGDRYDRTDLSLDLQR
jgi:hypothetical protein